jgi:hypothetical protein
MSEEKVYDFDSPLDAPPPKTVFPEGLAAFTVVEMKQVRKEVKVNKESIGPRSVAVLKLHVVNADTGDETDIVQDLPLSPVRIHLVRLYEFFAAIGQREHGDASEKFMPKWNKVVGSTGFLAIKHTASDKLRDDGTPFDPWVNISKFMNAADAEKWTPPKEKGEQKLKF